MLRLHLGSALRLSTVVVAVVLGAYGGLPAQQAAESQRAEPKDKPASERGQPKRPRPTARAKRAAIAPVSTWAGRSPT